MKEEVVFDKKGSLKTRGPLTYRIPRCTDIPGKLNVHILKDCPNNTHVYSSKVWIGHLLENRNTEPIRQASHGHEFISIKCETIDTHLKPVGAKLQYIYWNIGFVVMT